jgi:SAM-dependent methyltransferase
MSLDALRSLVTSLVASSSALAALAAALDARASGAPLDPELAAAIDEVLASIGAGDAVRALPDGDIRPLLGEIRAFALSNAGLLFAGTRRAGWAPTDPALLDAAGDVSSGFPRTLAALAPQLDGLEARLAAPTASFLDVGVGVGALSVEMARRWPSLRVVGIDVWAPALARAHERVRAAGLDDRIELREQAGEDLDDVDAFDLAWVPGVFVPAAAADALARRVHRALRPGGWLLFPSLRTGGGALRDAQARLRAAMFGGAAVAPGEREAMLRDAGFRDVRALPSASASTMIVGRR